MKKPEFDVVAAHKYFSANCFNRTWEYIDKPDRSADDNEEMLRLSQSSLWHWTQREDCTDQNLSIAHWLLSRVYALIGRAEDSMNHGQKALNYGKDSGPFYIGYAYEAMTRAAGVAGEKETFDKYLKLARENAEKVTDSEERKYLDSDLDNLTN